MKILMLTPYLPYPLLSGGQIRTYNLVKNLSKKHQITLFSLIKDEDEKKYVPQLKKFCNKVILLKRTKKPFHIRNILLAGFSKYPFLVTRNLPKNGTSKIRQELENENYDLIHAETFYMMPNIPNTKIPTILVEQTIEYLGYESYVKKSKLWPLKPFLYYDIQKINHWEKYFWQKADKLISMSDEDKKFIQNQVGQKLNIEVVANGVDINFFNKTQKELPQDPTVLFVGTFKWLPNVDAVTFLVEEIWPLILKSLPQAKLHIVGFSPNKKILNYGKQSSIKISGGIKDIRKAYGSAHVLLAPVRSGKGTRFKILEAMATSTPIVATPLAVEGLDVEINKHVLVGKTSQQLAYKTIELLKDKILQHKLAQTGKQLVEKKYGWKVISNKLDQIYQELGNKK
jgi:glycosyltransferase involved in cell wall biosynthesis